MGDGKEIIPKLIFSMKNIPSPQNKKSPATLINDAEVTLKNLTDATKAAELLLNTYVVPVRQSIIKRFPVLFALLVSFGATATFLGLEKIITRYQFLDNSPELILLLGITILVFTGKLYKKLG